MYRSVVTLANVKISTELICQAPQPHRFLLNAAKTLSKIKFDKNPAYEKLSIWRLACILAEIDFTHKLALYNKNFLGCFNFVEIISRTEFLCYSYSLLKGYSRFGLRTEITKEGLDKLAVEISEESYKPRPLKRIVVAEKSGKKKVLGIANTRDKIVQKALYLILCDIFSPIFSDCNYGFRYNDTPHSALYTIEVFWKNVVWFIKPCFVQKFEKVNYKLLMSLVKQRIRDLKIEKIIWGTFKAGFINPWYLTSNKLSAWKEITSTSILNPLLTNIYWNELDKWVIKVLLPKYSFHNEHTKLNCTNSVYYKLKNPWYEKWLEALNFTTEMTFKLGITKHERLLKPIFTKKINFYSFSILTHENYLYYIRYANDFMFGLFGVKSVGVKIVQEVAYLFKHLIRIHGLITFILLSICEFGLVKLSLKSFYKKVDKRFINTLSIKNVAIDPKLSYKVNWKGKSYLLRLLITRNQNTNYNFYSNNFLFWDKYGASLSNVKTYRYSTNCVNKLITPLPKSSIEVLERKINIAGLFFKEAWKIKKNLPGSLKDVLTSNKRIEDVKFLSLCNSENLKATWVQIKNHPDILVFKALNELKNEWLVQTSESLIKNKHGFGIERETCSLKKKQETKSFTINSFRTKIIEKSVLNQVEPYLEGFWEWTEIDKIAYDRKVKKLGKNYFIKRKGKGCFEKKIVTPQVFSYLSVGSRLGLSYHDALKAIKFWPTSTMWFLDYEVNKTFEDVNKKRLINLCKKRIPSLRICALIEQIISTNLSKRFKVMFEKRRLVQKSTLSPFLYNIYMHELDSYLENIINGEQGNGIGVKISKVTEKHYKTNNELNLNKVHLALKKYGSIEGVKETVRNKKEDFYKKYGRKKTVNTENWRVRYIRHVDDFLIGIVGTKLLAEVIKGKVNTFLRSNLHLQYKKDDLVNKSHKPVSFLGFFIELSAYQRKTHVADTYQEAIARYKNRAVAKIVSINRRIGKSYGHVIQKALLLTFKTYLKRKNNLQETALKITQDSRWKSNAVIDLAIDHKKKEIDRKANFTMDYVREAINILPLPQNEKKKALIWSNFEKLRLKFLKGLDSIQKELSRDYQGIEVSSILKRKDTLCNQSIKDKAYTKSAKEPTKIYNQIGLGEKSLKRIKIRAPIREIVDRLRTKGFFHPIKNRVSSNRFIAGFNEIEIVTCYNSIINFLLGYYRPADNLSQIKSVVVLLKQGCIFTLAHKHNKTASWAYTKYTKNAVIKENDKIITQLRSSEELTQILRKFFTPSTRFEKDLSQLSQSYLFYLCKTNKLFLKCELKTSIIKNIKLHYHPPTRKVKKANLF